MQHGCFFRNRAACFQRDCPKIGGGFCQPAAVPPLGIEKSADYGKNGQIHIGAFWLPACWPRIRKKRKAARFFKGKVFPPISRLSKKRDSRLFHFYGNPLIAAWYLSIIERPPAGTLFPGGRCLKILFFVFHGNVSKPAGVLMRRPRFWLSAVPHGPFQNHRAISVPKSGQYRTLFPSAPSVCCPEPLAYISHRCGTK